MTAGESGISISDGKKATTVIGTGELDLKNEQEFRKALDAATASGKDVVVDLRPAWYIDTAIIAHLAGGGKAMLKQEKRLKVMVKPGSHPQYALVTVGFDTILDLVAAPVE